MRAEREQLAQLMSQPFARRPDYKQTKQSFDLFVQDLQDLEGDGMSCGDAIWLSSFTSRGRWQMSPPIPPIWRVALC
jgi:uncharacterized protein YoaH (UPF0181 family)